LYTNKTKGKIIESLLTGSAGKDYAHTHNLYLKIVRAIKIIENKQAHNSELSAALPAKDTGSETVRRPTF